MEVNRTSVAGDVQKLEETDDVKRCEAEAADGELVSQSSKSTVQRALCRSITWRRRELSLIALCSCARSSLASRSSLSKCIRCSWNSCCKHTRTRETEEKLPGTAEIKNRSKIRYSALCAWEFYLLIQDRVLFEDHRLHSRSSLKEMCIALSQTRPKLIAVRHQKVDFHSYMYEFKSA